VSNPSTLKKNHAVAFTGSREPKLTGAEMAKRGEQPMLPSIRIIPKTPECKLDKMARIDFGRFYAFDKDIAVYDFGKVEDRERLISQWLRVLQNIKNRDDEDPDPGPEPDPDPPDSDPDKQNPHNPTTAKQPKHRNKSYKFSSIEQNSGNKPFTGTESEDSDESDIIDPSGRPGYGSRLGNLSASDKKGKRRKHSSSVRTHG